MIRKVRKEDTSAITAIYNHYIAHTTITFELEPVSEEEMWTRIQHISEKYPYFVYETEGQIAGYCYVHGWKESKHSKKCTFYTLRFGCSFAAVNTIKPQLL